MCGDDDDKKREKYEVVVIMDGVVIGERFADATEGSRQ